MNEIEQGKEREHLTARDVVIGAAHAAQLAEVGGPAAHSVAQVVGVADAAKLAKDAAEGKDVRAMDAAAAAASVTLTTGVGGPAAQTAAKAVAVASALDAGERAINTARDAAQRDGVDDAEASRLQARSEAQPTYTTAYVEIERRAEAMQQMRGSADAQREDEPNGARWAREDIKALAHVRDEEKSVALDAIGRGMDANRGYAATIEKEAPELVNQVAKNKADREAAALDAGEAMSLAAIRERSRDAASEGVKVERVDGELKVTQPGRGIEGIDAETAQRMAREDMEDLRRIKQQDRLDDAATAIAENMRNPAYKAEFERIDFEAAKAVELLAAQSGEKVTPAAQKDATMTIDDATLERLAAVRERDRDEALKTLGVKRDDGDVSEKFVADLDSRMAKSQLEELGWRDRSDLDDVMRDLERLASKDWNRAAELWDKYRPGDIDKPAFIDGDDVDEKRQPSARREAANDERSSREESPSRERGESKDDSEFVTPDALRKRYLQAENKFYFRDDENKLAFEDKGRRLATEHNDPEVAKAMIELAEAKGWNSLKVKGTEEFKREVWLQASLKGMEVSGFQPRDVDLAKLEDLRKETDRKADKALNSIEQTPERARTAEREEPRRQTQRAEPAERSAVVDEQQRGLSDQQRQAVEAIKAVMRGRGDSEKAVDMAAAIAAERFQTNRVYVGKVLEHGAAPYEDNPKNENSYYVKLQTEAGERKVWGVDLPRALEEGKVKVGDDVALAYQGRQQVTVKVKERDDKGQVVGESEITTNRNTWDVRKLDQVREEVKQKLAERSGDRQPIVKVYDRDAARTDTRAEPTREPARESERARG